MPLPSRFANLRLPAVAAPIASSSSPRCCWRAALPKPGLGVEIDMEALRAAKDQGIAAKDVTPFLLQRIFETTEGRSLTANIELVLNNARLAAGIARAL